MIVKTADTIATMATPQPPLHVQHSTIPRQPRIPNEVEKPITQIVLPCVPTVPRH